MSIIPNEILSELARILERVALGVRDPEATKIAGERRRRMRNELRRKFGNLDVAVPFVRELRDER